MMHPLNKQQRKKIAEKKHKFINEKKGMVEAQRPSKVWRKTRIESLKEQETLDELKQFT